MDIPTWDMEWATEWVMGIAPTVMVMDIPLRWLLKMVARRMEEDQHGAHPQVQEDIILPLPLPDLQEEILPTITEMVALSLVREQWLLTQDQPHITIMVGEILQPQLQLPVAVLGVTQETLLQEATVSGTTLIPEGHAKAHGVTQPTLVGAAHAALEASQEVVSMAEAVVVTHQEVAAVMADDKT
jgi:hypothetical protein